MRSDFTRVYLRKPLTAPRIKGLFYPLHANKVVMVEKVLTPRGANREIFSPRVLEVDIDGPPPADAPNSLPPATPSTSASLSNSTRGARASSITFHLNGNDLDRSSSGLPSYSSSKSPGGASLQLKSPAPLKSPAVMTVEETLQAILQVGQPHTTTQHVLAH